MGKFYDIGRGLLGKLQSNGRDHSNMTELMKAIARRDPKALEALYDQYSRVIYSVILAIVKNSEDADEILGDIFLQIWYKAVDFDAAKGSAYSWMLAIARNKAIDRLRSKQNKNAKRHEQNDGEMDRIINQEAQTPSDHAQLSEQMGLVRTALAMISPEQRQVIEVAYFEGYSQSEIAVKLDLPLGTVKTRMRDGMKILHTLLKDAL